MEKQQATTTTTSTITSKSFGMCEKLYQAIQPSLKPLRRLTFRQQEATAAPDHPAHAVPQSKLPEPTPRTQAKTQKLNIEKAKPKPKPLPEPAPPKAEVRPLGTAPQPLPPPPPKEEKPKKGFNQRVEDYITQTKGKMRTGSFAGKVHSK